MRGPEQGVARQLNFTVLPSEEERKVRYLDVQMVQDMVGKHVFLEFGGVSRCLTVGSVITSIATSWEKANVSSRKRSVNLKAVKNVPEV